MKNKPLNPARARLQRLLPALRLPASDTSSREQYRFHKRVELRLAELARITGCTPEQCIGLALYLGSQGWTAFSLDESALEGHKRPTTREFHQRMILAAATYDEDGELRFDADKQRGHAFNEIQRVMGAPTISDDSARSYVAKYRNSTPPEHRSEELLALYEEDESKLPLELMVVQRRKRLQRALESAATRLAVKARGARQLKPEARETEWTAERLQAWAGGICGKEGFEWAEPFADPANYASDMEDDL